MVFSLKSTSTTYDFPADAGWKLTKFIGKLKVSEAQTCYKTERKGLKSIVYSLFTSMIRPKKKNRCVSGSLAEKSRVGRSAKPFFYAGKFLGILSCEEIAETENNMYRENKL